MIAMNRTYRSRKWLAAVAQIEQCVLCGAWGTQVAHRNEGKGTGLKTDKDNLEKALLDAIFDDDSRIWDGRVTKVWGVKGQIIIKIQEGAEA